jgi:hypothetical protein
VVKYLPQFGKAVYAFLLTFLGSVGTVMVGDVGLGDVTDGQWVTAVALGLTAGGGVYGIPYRPSIDRG